MPERRGRPAVPAAALPRRADRARRGAAGRRSPRTSIRRPSGRISTRSNGSPRAIRTAGPIARLESGGAVPLAGGAVEHDHPGVGRPFRAVRRPGRGAGPSRGDARRDWAADQRGVRPAGRRRRRRRGALRRRRRPARAFPCGSRWRPRCAGRPDRPDPFASAATARPSRSTSVRAARPPVSGSRTRKLRAPIRTARSVSRASARMASPTARATRSATPAGAWPRSSMSRTDAGPAVAGVARRLVPERGHPVGARVELDRSPDARVRRRRAGVAARPGHRGMPRCARPSVRRRARRDGGPGGRTCATGGAAAACVGLAGSAVSGTGRKSTAGASYGPLTRAGVVRPVDTILRGPAAG